MNDNNEHYKTLSDCLENGQWETANQISRSLMQPADLPILDELWTKFSHGRFGLSVQSKIWRSIDCLIAAPPDYNYAACWESGDSDVQFERVENFAQQVGWLNSNGLWYMNLDFSLNAPYGHLPLVEGNYKVDLILHFSYIITTINS
ncbi:GUN4 domain protein (plasmid) [Calothrix sp. NIES-4071]|nr:GUN4 domain protein [Calothrix sp. NIES-4071]BAZ64991.1 GUN4 domain protein [Calothrix sp. NIES-4105]